MQHTPKVGEFLNKVVVPSYLLIIDALWYEPPQRFLVHSIHMAT